MSNNNEVSELLCATDDKNSLIQDLKAKLEKLEKKVIIQKKKINILKSKSRINAIQKYNHKKGDKFRVLKTIFKEDQILSLSRKNMKFIKWSNDTIKEGLELKFTCDQSGYKNFLKFTIPIITYPTTKIGKSKIPKWHFNRSL